MLEKKSILAIVVTYHPDSAFPDRFERLAEQVDAVLIVDNNSDTSAVSMLRETASRLNMRLILNSENLGIGAALNIGVAHAIADGYEWALLFDQDTTPSDLMVDTLREAYDQFPQKEKLAVIGSNYLDPRLPRPFLNFDQHESCSWQELKMAITSGSLISLIAYRMIGPFREEFFIDCVDFEYCLRARSQGFRVIVAREPLMGHSIGAVTLHWLPWKMIVTTNHSPLRRYYMTRNGVALAREFFWKEPACVASILYKHFRSSILMCLFEKDIRRKVKYTAMGLLDGLSSDFSRKLTSSPIGTESNRIST